MINTYYNRWTKSGITLISLLQLNLFLHCGEGMCHADVPLLSLAVKLSAAHICYMMLLLCVQTWTWTCLKFFLKKCVYFILSIVFLIPASLIQVLFIFISLHKFLIYGIQLQQQLQFPCLHIFTSVFILGKVQVIDVSPHAISSIIISCFFIYLGIILSEHVQGVVIDRF